MLKQFNKLREYVIIRLKGVMINTEKFLKNYTINDVSEVVEKIKKIEIRKKEFEELKGKLEKYFKFEIVDYIVSDILDCETYNHVCLMINLAVVNNRISLENGITLKNELKKLFKINDIFDKFDKGNYIMQSVDKPDN